MLPVFKLIEVHELLQSGQYSHREVARRASVSRSTVAAVAHGRRPLETLLEREAEAYPDELAGPVGRCPSCGGKVMLPCRACFVRSLKQPETLRDPAPTLWRGSAVTSTVAVV